MYTHTHTRPLFLTSARPATHLRSQRTSPGRESRERTREASPKGLPGHPIRRGDTGGGHPIGRGETGGGGDPFGRGDTIGGHPVGRGDTGHESHASDPPRQPKQQQPTHPPQQQRPQQQHRQQPTEHRQQPTAPPPPPPEYVQPPTPLAVSPPNYFEVLGIDRGASDAEVPRPSS